MNDANIPVNTATFTLLSFSASLKASITSAYVCVYNYYLMAIVLATRRKDGARHFSTAAFVSKSEYRLRPICLNVPGCNTIQAQVKY